LAAVLISRAAWVRCRYQPAPDEVVDIFLALGNENPLVDSGRDQSGQAVEDFSDVGRLPDPSALPVWAALPEILRIEATDLVEQLAALVVVGIDCDDLPHPHTPPAAAVAISDRPASPETKPAA